ncbi:MAG: phosphopantothenate---cysteine ligase [Verrucomicrobiota bacterium]|jgi:phosphopantothenoylcysteine synthetase/decarboxylase
MKVIVTTGPSYEPIDEVRRITNFSTGELGVLLANSLARGGDEVFCLKGSCSTTPESLVDCHELRFTTNDDLQDQLSRLAREHDITALFHVAALCDYKVRQVQDRDGTRQTAAKIESRSGDLTLTLEPAPKVIAGMRHLFPRAVLVGWKYELNGIRADALAKAWSQISDNRTDACVVNGSAWGEGFGFCTPPEHIREFRDKNALVEFLSGWVKRKK